MDDLLDLMNEEGGHIEPAYEEGLAYLVIDGVTFRAPLNPGFIISKEGWK